MIKPNRRDLADEEIVTNGIKTFLKDVGVARRNLDHLMREYAIHDNLTLFEAYAMVLVNTVDVMDEAYDSAATAAALSYLCGEVFLDRREEFDKISKAFRRAIIISSMRKS